MTARDVHSGLTARHAMVIVHDVTATDRAQPAAVQRVIQTDHVVMATALSVASRATDHVVTLIAQTATPLRENTASLAPVRPRWRAMRRQPLRLRRSPS
jgi:hypothetical protein